MDSKSVELLVWRYGAACLDEREHDLGDLAKDELKQLLLCRETVEVPPPELVRKAFPRPFKHLGNDCTYEDMEHYWHETHRTLEENTPVYRACAMDQVTEKTWPDGTWWRVWYVDYTTKQPREGILVHNTHRLPVEEGMVVYIHGGTIAEVTDREASL
jgi:hypothetical protein